jgi:hypothetical protein
MTRLRERTPGLFAPTAKQLAAPAHETSSRNSPAGLVTKAQLEPFHRSMNAEGVVLPFPCQPTAKQFVALVHDAPRSSLNASPSSGAGSNAALTDQAVPFQRSVRRCGRPTLDWLPTATQRVALVHDTSMRDAFVVGGGTIDHVVPFQRSIRPASPTAKQLVVPAQDTPKNCPFVTTALGTSDQVAPFHRSVNGFRRPVESTKSPAAMHSVALTHETSASSLLLAPAMLGLAPSAQLVPFHCSMSACDAERPTAKQCVVPAHETPTRARLTAPGGFGGVTIDQLEPSHASADARSWPDGAVNCPTAMQLVMTGQATASRVASGGPVGLGLGTIDQVAPFHCSTSVRMWSKPSSTGANVSRPAAKHVAESGHDTAASSPVLVPGRFGLGTIDQLVPFHCSVNVAEAPPTAEQVAALVHETASSPARGSDGFGVATAIQLVPSQRSTSGRELNPLLDLPTAKQLASLTHDTPASWSAPEGLGLATIDHAPASQRSTSVPENTPLLTLPTAKQLVVLAHDTPARFELAPPRLGLATIDQTVPFQRSINVAASACPTAKQSVTLVHATPENAELVAPDGLGLATIDQTVPFQRSINVAEPAWPTAKHKVTLGHSTPARTLLALTLDGVSTRDHVLPFHDSIKVLLSPEGLTKSPAATQLVALVQSTAERCAIGGPSGFGLGEIVHAGAACAGIASAETMAIVTRSTAATVRVARRGTPPRTGRAPMSRPPAGATMRASPMAGIASRRGDG